MNEINLNQIIIDHPDCLTSGSKLRAILLDLYPSASKAIVNTLATMDGAGIADEIIRADEITDLDKARWHKKLEDDYGLSEKIICSCLDLFLGSQNSIRLCIKANEKPVNKPSPSEQLQKPSHSGLDDFEIENGVLKKYKGKGSIVIIPNNVTSIGSSAFEYCDSLTSIMISNSVTSIGDFAFSGCDSLNYNEYDNAMYLGNNDNPYFALIKCKSTNITNCNINEQTKVIADSAFWACSSLTNFDVKNNKYYQAIDGNLYSKDGKTLVQYVIGKKANSFTISNSVTRIGDSAFEYCDSLTSITIPNSVTSIGDFAFGDCSSLTSITIPNNVTSIGDSAFSNCSELTQINFAGSEDQWKAIKKSVGWNQGVPINCKTHFSLSVKKANGKPVNKPSPSGRSQKPSHSSLDDFEIEKGVLIKYKGKSPVVYIPNGVKTIKAWAFMGRADITGVTIPHSVIELRENAFSECRNLSEVLISEGMKSIGNSAFSGCSKLTRIVLPSTITEIGTRAFDCCPLKNIDYNGTETQWNEVYKGSLWVYNVSAIRVTFAREGKDDSSELRYVFHDQMGYGVVENIGRYITVRFDEFPYKSYSYRMGDLGTFLQQVSRKEYIADRKKKKPDPVVEVKTPSVNQYDEKQSYGDEYGTYYESRSLEDEEIDSRTRYERSIGHDMYDDDNTDDEYDYSDDYDVSDSDYPDYYD